MQASTRRAQEVAIAIGRHWPYRASTGLILGTGAAAVAEAFGPECKIAYSDLPHLMPATAVGHPGCFIGGRAGDEYLAILQGRIHLYEGYSPQQVQLPVHLLAALGVTTLIVTNASGGLNTLFRSGDLVVIDDLVDLTFCNSDAGRRPAFPDKKTSPRRNVFSPELATKAVQAGRRLGIAVHKGTYAAVLGPNYETRAEYRLLRRIADVVGMSTALEVAAAGRLGIRVLALSVVTNECCPDNLSHTTGELVVHAVERASDRLARLLTQLCSDL